MKLKSYCIFLVSLLFTMCIFTSQVEAKTFDCDPLGQGSNSPLVLKDLFGTGKELTGMMNGGNYLSISMLLYYHTGTDLKTIEDGKYIINTKLNKVYYCDGFYVLSGADAKTFEEISTYLAKDKNRMYFLKSRENDTYTIVSNDKKINTSSLKTVNLSNRDFDRGYYYSYGNDVFMINRFQKNTGDDIMEYKIIPLGIKKNQLTGGQQQHGVDGIFVGKNPLIYGAILSGAKLPLDMSPVLGSYLTVVDANGKIWKYSDKFGKLISGPRYLEFDQLINSSNLGSWSVSPDSKIIDDYIVYDGGSYYANREQGMLITNIDNGSFKSLGDFYQDKNYTYAKICIGTGDFTIQKQGFSQCELQILNGLSGSLIALGAGFTKDNSNIYHTDTYQGFKTWTGDGLWDLGSFMSKSWPDNIMMGYGDKNRFYCTRGESGFPTIMLTGTNVQDIKLIDGQYRTDGKSIYARECSLWTGVDGSTFRSITLSGQSVGLYADKSGLYFGMFNQGVIKDIDISTLNVLGFIINYSLIVKDKNGLYILNGGMVGGYPKLAKLPISNQSYKLSNNNYLQGTMTIEDDKYKCDGYGSGTSNSWQYRCTKKSKK